MPTYLLVTLIARYHVSATFMQLTSMPPESWNRCWRLHHWQLIHHGPYYWQFVSMSGNTKFMATTTQRKVWFFTKIISAVALSLWAAWLRTTFSGFKTLLAVLSSIRLDVSWCSHLMYVIQNLSITTVMIIWNVTTCIHQHIVVRIAHEQMIADRVVTELNVARPRGSLIPICPHQHFWCTFVPSFINLHSHLFFFTQLRATQKDSKLPYTCKNHRRTTCPPNTQVLKCAHILSLAHPTPTLRT